MIEIEKMLGPQLPTEIAETCKTIVRKGFDIGHVLGEKVNEWIDSFFDNLK